MDSDLARAQYYRDQAQHMRSLAANEDSEQVRKDLIELAENYERLCQACLGRLA